MTGVNDYWAFIVAAAIFSVTPGIDTFFVLNRSVAQGRRSGVFSTLGIITGVLVHTLIAAVGLSAVIAQSAFAFSLLKYLGASYLVFLGVAKLLRPSAQSAHTQTLRSASASTPWQDYRSGVLTNVLNPKVGLFFLAFFPQFIKPDMLQSGAPFVVLGVTYAAIGLAWLLVLCWLACAVSRRMRETPAFGRWMDRVSGTVFMAMGVRVAVDAK